MGNSVKNPFCGRDESADAGAAGIDSPQTGSSESRKSKRAKRSGGGKNGAKSSQNPAAAGTGEFKDLRPFSVDEAVQLQMELRAAFADKSFQQLMSRIKERYPQCAKEGHHDNQMFTADLQKLMLNVYNRVLPKPPWSLPSGPLGARQMHARMAAVAEHPSVRSVQEQIEDLLRGGHSAGSLEDPLLVDSRNGNGAVDEYHIPLIEDPDGDLAHEFWVMDGRCSLQRADARSHPVEVLVPAKREAKGKREREAANASNVVV